MSHDKARWHRNALISGVATGVLCVAIGWAVLWDTVAHASGPWGGGVIYWVMFLFAIGIPGLAVLVGFLSWAIVYSIGDALVERDRKSSRKNKTT
jgi:hypothetical protein